MWTKKIIGIITVVLVSGSAYAATFAVDIKNLTTGAALGEYTLVVRSVKVSADGDYQTLSEIETKTAPDGTAKGMISTPPGSSLMAEAIYRSIHYRSEVVRVSNPDDVVKLSLPVYDITDNRAGVSIPERTMVITVKKDDLLEIFDSLTVENTGKYTYVGKFNDELDMNQVLFIPMPRAYMLYGFSGYIKPRLTTTGKGLLTQNETEPGTTEINMRYYVKSDIGMFDLSLYTEKDAPEFNRLTVIFPASEQWRIKPSGFKAAGSHMIGGKNYVVLKGIQSNVSHIKVYGPSYSGGFGIWDAAIVLSFAVGGLFLFFSRGALRSWQLAREEKRLQGLLEKIHEYSASGSPAGYFDSFAKAIEGRLTEIEEEFGEEG